LLPRLASAKQKRHWNHMFAGLAGDAYVASKDLQGTPAFQARNRGILKLRTAAGGTAKGLAKPMVWLQKQG
jgi:hypothetical protein